MLSPDRWSIPERHMVRYHVAQLAWWWSGIVGALIVAVGIVSVLTRAHVLHAVASDKTWWYATLAVTPLLTVLSFGVRPRLPRPVPPGWNLYRTITYYKRTCILAMSTCLVAGLLPCVVVALLASLGLPMLVTTIPLVALLLHFPNGEKFARFVEDTGSVESRDSHP